MTNVFKTHSKGLYRMGAMLFVALFWAAVIAAMFFWPEDAEAQEWQPEQQVMMTAGCFGEEAARAMSALVAEDGDAGYAQAILDPKIMCADVRYMPFLKPQPMRVGEVEWTVVHGDTGLVYEFWSLYDYQGRKFYTYKVAEEDEA